MSGPTESEPTERTHLVFKDLEQSSSFIKHRTTSSVLRRRSSFSENLQEVGTVLEWWMFMVLLVSGLAAAVGVPHMAYGLFSQSLREKTGITEDGATLILNCGMVGGMVLCFVPGMLYDAYGYKFMVAFGGAFSLAGALTWFLYLAQGGTSVLPLAIGYFMQSFGARTQFLTGQVASMSAFPAELAGSVSATLAICVSLGYIFLPVSWKALFHDPEATSAMPVARFHAFLACIFLFNTLAGLAISRLMGKVNPPETFERERPSILGKVLKLVSKDGFTLIAMVTLSFSFLIVYISAGCAAVGKEALGSDVSASARDSQVSSVLSNVGTFGMVGRFVLGFGADFLQLAPAVGKAARWICLMTAAALTAFVYVIYCAQYAQAGAAQPLMWKVGSCILGFAFGAFGAIFPATVRVLFPADVGLLFGGLTSYTGALNVLYTMIFVKMHWTSSVWQIFSLGSIVDTLVLLYAAWRYWGEEP